MNYGIAVYLSVAWIVFIASLMGQFNQSVYTCIGRALIWPIELAIRLYVGVIDAIVQLIPDEDKVDSEKQ